MFDDCFGPPRYWYTGPVQPHYSTQTIWGILHNRERFPRNPSSWLDGLIGIPIPPITFPKILKTLPSISIDDIVSVQPMTMTGSLLFIT